METDEELESGYGQAAPPGDNLCNDYAQGLADAFAELAVARGDRVETGDPRLMLADGSSGSMFASAAVVRRPVGESEWGDVAAAMHSFFDGRDGVQFIVFSAWPTPDLRALGFGRIGHPPLMFRPPGPIDTRPVEGFEIVPVTDAATCRDWEYAMVHGYPEPGLQPLQPGCLLPVEALAAPRWRHWIGYLDGDPVSTASAYVGEHHVDVEFVATIAAARGRGIGRAITATATLAAPELPALLISSDDGRNIYAGLGYVPVLRFTLWAGHNAPTSRRTRENRP